MPIFQYQALNRNGEKVTGIIEANTSQLALEKLRNQNLFPKEIFEDIARRDRYHFPLLSKLLYNVPRKSISLFCRQLGTLLGAGISLDSALADIVEQTDNKNLRKIVADMRSNVIEGKTLSETLNDHSDVFPPVYENMVRLGEATGSYEKTLHRLADLEDKNSEMRSKIVTAMIYPSIMLFISITVVIFLMAVVVPQVQTMFAKFEGNLPLITKIVIFASDLVRNYLTVFLLGIGLFSYLFYRYRSKPKGKLKIDTLLLKIPIIGSLIRKGVVASFSRNLGILLENQVQLLTAIDIVKNITNNQVFLNELTVAQERINEGDSLREAIKDSKVLPHMAKGMLSAGESGDQLSNMLIKIAEIMEGEVDAGVKNMTTSLEPIMLVVLGLVVGGIMASVMMPMYQMVDLIK